MDGPTFSIEQVDANFSQSAKKAARSRMGAKVGAKNPRDPKQPYFYNYF
jgi:hypothetical protein